MKLSISLSLDPAEIKQLSGILRTPAAGLDSTFSPYAKAAIQEYIQMFLGQKVFTRGTDMREFRLFLLIKSAFNNKIPDEQNVCDLFQCTQSQGRSLLRAVMSKYQYELSDAINATLKELVNSARKEESSNLIAITVNNETLIEALNRLLANIDGS